MLLLRGDTYYSQTPPLSFSPMINRLKGARETEKMFKTIERKTNLVFQLVWRQERKQEASS